MLGNVIKNYLAELNIHVFQVSLISYLCFLIIDYLREGYISNFFNLNIILFICVVSGFLMIILNNFIKNK